MSDLHYDLWHAPKGLVDILSCPTCRADLQYAGPTLRCNRCVSQYLILDGSTPVLFRGQVGPFLAQAAIWFKKQISENQARIDRLLLERWAPPLWDSKRNDLINGLRSNSAFLEATSHDIFSQTYQDGDEAGVTPLTSTEYNEFSYYLARDWSGSRTRESIAISVAISECLSRLNVIEGRALVLGAGLGRIAADLCKHFDRVIALDRSIIAAALFHRLSEGFEYFHERFANSLTMAEQTRVIRHSWGGDVRELVINSELNFVAADALVCPFASGSIDCAISSFFTDVVGLDAILPEARRVLTKGGIFVHFGPLHYHFSERGRMFPVDMLRAYVRDSGFEILEDVMVDMSIGEHKADLLRTHYSCWLLAARKI